MALVIATISFLFGTGIVPRLHSLLTAPTTPETWIERGLQKCKIGKLEEGIDCFNEALKKDPENIEAWNQKVDPFMLLGRDKEANIAFSKVIALRAKEAALCQRETLLDR